MVVRSWRRGRRGLRCEVVLAGVLGGVCAGSYGAEAARVVLAPLEPHSVTFEDARAVSRRMAKAISSSGVEVFGPNKTRQAFDIDLSEHVRACAGDVFCLTELGSVLEAERVVFGRLTARSVAEDSRDSRDSRGDRREERFAYELRLSALDVRRAKVVETLVWRVDASRDEEGLDAKVLEMAAAAAHRLACPPDLRIAFVVEPSDAVVRVYGERFKVPKDARDFAYWSGEYLVSFERRGYVAQTLSLSLRRSGIVRRVDVALDVDPLFTEGRPEKPVEPFSETSRRSGSGISSLDVARMSSSGSPSSSPSHEASAYPWVVTAVGVGMVTAGLVLAANAQADYNAVAEDVRFLPGVTSSAEAARSVRSDALSTVRAGSVVAFVGVAAVVGGLLWLAGDEGWFATSGDEAVSPAGRRRVDGEFGGVLRW
ncbi:MAG: hypothetical protein H6729_09555 [Deltaproteobacteria bacterium]|nr:hypothetical protein [Deltaproteobacteria bacterium]